MIELCIEDYCQNCPSFDPTAKRVYMNDKVYTIVECENELKCSMLHDHIKKEFEKEKNNDQD